MRTNCRTSKNHFYRLYIKRLRIGSSRLFTIDDYYTFDLAVLGYNGKVVPSIHMNGTAISFTEIKRMKQSLPIQSLADVAVDGKDLIEWTGQRRQMDR